MFLLWTVRDSVRVSPALMRLEWASVLCDEIDARYANKVLEGVGLVVCLVDILSCGDSVLPPGDGAAHADGALRAAAPIARARAAPTPHPRPLRLPAVTFRLLVFRPFVKELLTGRVKSVDAALGVCVSLEFFEDVWVPTTLLRSGMSWRDAPGTGAGGGGEWVWVTLTAVGFGVTDDLAAFCEAYGLGVVSAGDVAWLKGESNG